MLLHEFMCANNHYLFLPLVILLFSSIIIIIVGIIIAILYTHLYIYIVHIGYYLYIYIYTSNKNINMLYRCAIQRDPLQALFCLGREHPHLPAQFSFYLTGRGSNDAKSLGDAG